jgi:hypothetical protein
MIATIIEPVFSAEILWESGDSGKTSFDHLRFAKRATADGNDISHLPGLGFEISFVVPHHSFRQREDDAIQIEQIRDGVVVLKTVHSPDRRM